MLAVVFLKGDVNLRLIYSEETEGLRGGVSIERPYFKQKAKCSMIKIQIP